jgi:uncharacterized protein
VRVFIDSGGWLSVLVRTDRHYQVGKSYFDRLLAQRARIWTTSLILDEVITRLRYDVGHAQAAEFIRLVQRSVAAGTLSVSEIDREMWACAEELFLKYSESKLSFTDCTSFALLRVMDADEVFGFHSHFEMMGFPLQPST